MNASADGGGSTPPARPPGVFWLYLVVAAIGLVGTAWFNIRSVVEPSGDTFFAAGLANPPGRCWWIALLLVAAAATLFINIEGRRLGIRWYWVYVVASFVTAIAFTFPLFLAVRERHLTRTPETQQRQ
ncbi:MAG: DUF2834 domain-containing protein, partial [Actinomycetota bacterium]|nr:DUF2834 domain-containing protein [Actinomycetota bacterium]